MKLQLEAHCRRKYVPVFVGCFGNLGFVWRQSFDRRPECPTKSGIFFISQYKVAEYVDASLGRKDHENKVAERGRDAKNTWNQQVWSAHACRSTFHVGVVEMDSVHLCGLVKIPTLVSVNFLFTVSLPLFYHEVI